ncbi:hypothetical protein [Frankia sp. EI5c]|uniref:hypothetical protein n=1 Tax=Frankia sp. EI5c TaxID=683316 RepID=UPI000826D597|nr:hypothetical protein [Frankia sp. EI5c]
MIATSGLRRSDSGAVLFHRLREGVLALDPAVEGMLRHTAGTIVWGALMEIGSAEGTVTVVSLADGTTSLYASAGGGVVGGGAHSSVVTATRHFLAVVEERLTSFEPDGERALVPGDERIAFRALTYGGRRYAEAAEKDLREPDHIFSPLYRAGYAVLNRLRFVAAARVF